MKNKVFLLSLSLSLNILDFFKCLVCCLDWNEWTRFHKFSNWGHDIAEILNKSPIECSHSMEALHLMDIYKPTNNSFDLIQIYFNSVENMTKPRNTSIGLMEVHFFKLMWKLSTLRVRISCIECSSWSSLDRLWIRISSK